MASSCSSSSFRCGCDALRYPGLVMASFINNVGPLPAKSAEPRAPGRRPDGRRAPPSSSSRNDGQRCLTRSRAGLPMSPTRRPVHGGEKTGSALLYTCGRWTVDGLLVHPTALSPSPTVTADGDRLLLLAKAGMLLGVWSRRRPGPQEVNPFAANQVSPWHASREIRTVRGTQ